MLDVDTGRDELSTLLRHRSQEPLALFIDGRDFIEIDNALQRVGGSTGLFPASPQFANPQPN
jgi:hypothetical protein